MNRLRFAVILLLAAVSTASSAAAEAGDCAAYSFGRIVDQGRWFGGGPRPIDFGLWVPSGCGGVPVTRRDLVRDAMVQSGETEAQIIGITDPAPALGAALDRPTGAVRAVPGPAPPRPLVVYIHPSVIDAAPVAERLVRDGFAVASLTWRGTHSQPFDVGVSGMVSEMLDAQAVIRDLIRRGVAQDRRIFVIGMSFGALTALCLAQADPRVAALVSHDGGISTPTGVRLSPLCPYFAPQRPRARALFLYDSSYAQTIWDVVERLTNLPRQIVPVPLLEHRDYVGTVLLRAEADPAMIERDARLRNYRAVAEATADFLRCVRDTPERSCEVALNAR